MNKLTVLIVEDHWLAQHMLQLLFASYSHYDVDCQCVDTAEQALRAVADQTYDLIIVDLGLPDQNGFELAQALRQMGVKAPLLGLTSHLDPGVLQHAQAPAFTALLEKPLTHQCRINDLRLSEFIRQLKANPPG